MPRLDHLIMSVNDLDESVLFYTQVIGLKDDGKRAPFAQLRVQRDFVILLAPFGTEGNDHFAFCLTQAEFEETFERIRKAGLEYGDTFDQASNMKGPGTAEGAHGESVSLYLFDPNHHLIELLYYK